MTEQIKIIKIVPSGKFAKLTISGVENSLFVPDITVYQNSLVEGVVITASQLQILKDADEAYRCEQKAMRYLAMREHSVGELKTKLRQKQFSEKAINPLVAKLRKLDYLNDERYAQMLIRRISESKPGGKGYLLSHLKRKLIDNTTATHAVEHYLRDIDLKDEAVRALDKRWHRWAELELEEARIKAYNYLSRRGFNFEAAKFAFESMKTTSNEDNEN